MAAFCGEANGMARLQRQLVPGTIEHALGYLVDHKIDLSGFDRRYHNDVTGPQESAVAARVSSEARERRHGFLKSIWTRPLIPTGPQESAVVGRVGIEAMDRRESILKSTCSRPPIPEYLGHY